MNSVIVFKEQEILGKHFRVFGTPEEPLFLAKDTAEWIEHKDVSTMLRNIDENEKIKITLQTISGGLQPNTEYWFLTEDGLYEVLMQSRKPLAKQFKKEVKVILKSIRKHGLYATEELLNNPDLAIKAFTALKEEREKSKRLELENAELKPKAEFADQITNAKNMLNFAQTSKVLNIEGFGRNNLLKFLRDSNVLMEGEYYNNLPKQMYIQQGYFKVIVKPVNIKGKIIDM
jgi:anti-repressor protein